MSDSAKTLPASWYCSKPLYGLEQRAVFMKVRMKATLHIYEERIWTYSADDFYQGWYLLGPVTRFADQTQVRYEVAGVRLLVESTEDGFRVSSLSEVLSEDKPQRK